MRQSASASAGARTFLYFARSSELCELHVANRADRRARTIVRMDSSSGAGLLL